MFSLFGEGGAANLLVDAQDAQKLQQTDEIGRIAVWLKTADVFQDGAVAVATRLVVHVVLAGFQHIAEQIHGSTDDGIRMLGAMPDQQIHDAGKLVV